jgi:hypothetical protein
MNITARTWSHVAAVAFAAGLLIGCADQSRLLAPSAPRMNGEPPGQAEPFFKAWSWIGVWRASPTQTQVFMDSRQYRQIAGLVVDTATVYPFARSNPGKLYVNGDEPDMSCTAPSSYAVTYHGFVAAIHAVDPTARVSPAGFAEYVNDGCAHATSYAQQFYDAYLLAYGSAPPVDEWRFHDFGLSVQNDTTKWKDSVSTKAAWSAAHGANMVLGSWGFTNWDADSLHGCTGCAAAILFNIRQMQLFLQRDGRINQAVWCSFEDLRVARTPPDSSCGKYFLDSAGVQTQAGYAYQYFPPAQIPTAVNAIGGSGHAVTIRWTNTSGSWPMMVDFWVKPSGSGTFTYNRSVWPGAGTTSSGVQIFNLGDQVKGRVIYYNGTTIGEWSAFSNAVLVH